MTSAYGELPYIGHAECPTLLYTGTIPDAELESGELLSLQDFHQAAEVAQTTQSVGTRVMKEVASDLEHPEVLPFSRIQSLNGGAKGITIYTREGSITLSLRKLYLRTQAVYDHYSGLDRKDARRLYGAKGSLVLHAVLFDEYISDLDEETPEENN